MIEKYKRIINSPVYHIVMFTIEFSISILLFCNNNLLLKCIGAYLFILTLSGVYKLCKKDIDYAIVLFFTTFYDMYLYKPWFKTLYHGTWIVAIFFSFCFRTYGRLIILILLLFAWRRFFHFPWKKKKIFNTIMGPPGSGKSTFCAFIAKWAKANNEPVYSNCDVKETYKFSWAKDFGQYMIEDATIVIDEAALEEGMNNRDYKKNFADEIGKQRLDTAKKHRHYGLDIWMFSQADDTDIKLRELTQNYYVLRKMPVPWLLKIRLYDTDIDLDPMTQDFRKVRIKKRTYILFTPVVWLSFDTHERTQLPQKEWVLR